jgi:site-specific recombinase XerD
MEIQLDERTALILAPTAAPDLVTGWRVAPGDESALATWIKCRDAWLRAKQRKSGGQNTVNAYTNDWNDFFTFFRTWEGQTADGEPTFGLMPWQVGRLHSEIWVSSLTERGLAPSTIVRKVAALSSFYNFAMIDYTIQVPFRGQQALWDHPNPFHVRDLPKTQHEPIFPTSAEISAIFAQIDCKTITGLRNLAIIAGMFGTTRRVTEWLSLKWGDIQESSTGHFFRYRYKGGEIKKQDMPRDLYTLIVRSLQAAKRWPLADEDYVFVALDDSAKQFGGLAADYDPAGQPLSESYAWALLQRYGSAAGIDKRKLHPHGLRHAGARYRRKALGADIEELQQILGHKQITTTMIYTHEVLDEPEDKYGDRIGDMLPRQYKLLFKDL